MYWFNGDETKLLNSAEFTLGDVSISLHILKSTTAILDSSKNKKIKNSDYFRSRTDCIDPKKVE